MLNRYEIDQTINIFKNDKEFQDMLSDCNTILNDEDYRSIAIILLENKELINSKTIDELNEVKPPVARDELAEICGKDYIEGYMYRQIIYTFKYSTIKIFFRQNYSKFMPDYDFTIINSQPKMKLFVEAFMREYDRFASIIDEMYNLVDVDKAPEKYLNYLAQAVGYEREDSNLLNNVSFRELIKNIVEVYKIKGTNYSFELFFNFLGFQVELKEYWFDKRLGDPNITSNPETGTSNKNTFSFYLTTNKPTEYIPSGMRNPYIVSENKIIGTLDVNEFNRKIGAGEYTASQLLGDETGYSGQTYTFFKTNVMEYTLENIRTEEGESSELSASDLSTIERYANFLTPIFMQKNIVVSIKPFQDFAGAIILTDADREDPRSATNRSESMIHNYEGYQPAYYYWEDGVKYYNETALRREKEGIRPNSKNPEGGGHFVSGFYLDTTEEMPKIKNSIEEEFPYKSEAERLEILSSRIADGSVFSNDFAHRDLSYPLIDKEIYYPFRSVSTSSEMDTSPLFYLQDFSFRRGEQKRLSEAYNEELDNKGKIQSIVLDNGSGNSLVNISRLSTYRFINSGDEIKLFYTKDQKNNGTFTVLSVNTYNNIIEIELDGKLNSKQKTPGGFIQIYRQDWKMENFKYPFMFDRILNTSAEKQKTLSDESYHYIDYDLSKSVDDDRTVTNSQMYFYDDTHYIPLSSDADDTQMSSFKTFMDLAEQELEVSGLYDITYNSTTYIRSSYHFYNENPDFYMDYLDVVKT